jgi:glycosyltransferase involved in cell wall biosynthesis
MDLQANAQPENTATKNPTVSVIIPCHNYGHFIGETIESVLDQTYKPVEILVVDDGSTDNTKDIVSLYKQVKYVYQDHKGNRTPARAHNTGLIHSKGEFIIMLGADDRIDPEYVQRCYDTYMWHTKAKNRKVAFVWTGYQTFGDFTTIKMPRTELLNRFNCYINPAGALGAMFVPREAYLGLKSASHSSYWELIDHASKPEAIGLYDESLHGLEDWDWAIRACKQGWIGIGIPQAIHYYRQHGSSANQNAIRNNLITELYNKHPKMQLYIKINRAPHWTKLFLRQNKTFRIRIYNRAICSIFKVNQLLEPTTINAEVNQAVNINALSKKKSPTIINTLVPEKKTNLQNTEQPTIPLCTPSTN